MSDALNLDLGGVGNPDAMQQNLQKIQDAMNGIQTGPQNLQVVELFVTGSQTGLKIGHNLGAVPLDVVVSRLVAPSSARLIAKYSEFTKSEVVFDITGLDGTKTLSARILVAAFSNVVTVGDVKRGDAETQEFRSSF